MSASSVLPAAAEEPVVQPVLTTACLLLSPAVEATIRFTYVEKYPDEPPLWEIHSQENLEDRDAEDILTLLQQQVGPRDPLVLSCFSFSPEAPAPCWERSSLRAAREKIGLVKTRLFTFELCLDM